MVDGVRVILAQLLILLLAFTLLTAFAVLNGKGGRLGQITLQALTRQRDLTLVAPEDWAPRLWSGGGDRSGAVLSVRVL
jgi:hypothetical protein